jgi:hypothetical protein
MRDMGVERLGHLGSVAGIWRGIGLAEYLDALAGPSQQRVRVGTSTVAMILNRVGSVIAGCIWSRSSSRRRWWSSYWVQASRLSNGNSAEEMMRWNRGADSS